MEHTAQVMGIAGAGRGTGVTHFVIQAANYLCSCRQKKTAILQWNPQKDLEKIRAFLGAGGKEDSRSLKKKDHFRLLGVDYYYEGDPAVLRVWKKITRKYSLISEKSGKRFFRNGSGVQKKSWSQTCQNGSWKHFWDC